jgi:hypothetical protein
VEIRQNKEGRTHVPGPVSSGTAFCLLIVSSPRVFRTLPGFLIALTALRPLFCLLGLFFFTAISLASLVASASSSDPGSPSQSESPTQLVTHLQAEANHLPFEAMDSSSSSSSNVDLCLLATTARSGLFEVTIDDNTLSPSLSNVDLGRSDLFELTIDDDTPWQQGVSTAYVSVLDHILLKGDVLE